MFPKEFDAATRATQKGAHKKDEPLGDSWGKKLEPRLSLFFFEKKEKKDDHDSVLLVRFALAISEFRFNFIF